MNFRMIGGIFHRIVPEARKALALSPAVSPEGRFHQGRRGRIIYVAQARMGATCD